MKAYKVLTIMIALVLLNSCASFRSEIKGTYQGEIKKKNDNSQVNVLFIITHITQIKGLDTVPKLENRYQIMKDFNIIFADALRELNNIKKYDMFTDDQDDVNNTKRRLLRDSLITHNDYTLQIRIEENSVFIKQFFASLVSTISLTIIPAPYSKEYSIEVKIFDHNRKLLNTYHREASLVKWVEPLLIFLYPFHPEERKKEEIYVNFLHDIFKQIENEAILNGNNSQSTKE